MVFENLEINRVKFTIEHIGEHGLPFPAGDEASVRIALRCDPAYRRPVS